MAKIKALPAEHIISGFKGKLDYYVHNGVACVRKWPRSPGRRRAPAVEAGWPAFAYAATEWKNLSPEVQESYNRMAEGTGLSGRDMFQRAYLKGVYPYPKIEEVEMKLVLLDEEIVIAEHNNTGVSVPWTDIDLTAHVSAAATIAYLQVMIACNTKDVAGVLDIHVRKKGSTITKPVMEYFPKVTVGFRNDNSIMCGLDDDKKLEYKVTIPGGLDEVWAHIYLLGYME